MKKIFRVIIVFTFIGIMCLGYSIQKSSAAGWSDWKTPIDPNNGSFPTGCQIRLWTDANTYSSSATTIDFQIEQNGKCGQLSYNAVVYEKVPFTQISPVVSGYFSNISPIKQFKLNDLSKSGINARLVVYVTPYGLNKPEGDIWQDMYIAKR